MPPKEKKAPQKVPKLPTECIDPQTGYQILEGEMTIAQLEALEGYQRALGLEITYAPPGSGGDVGHPGKSRYPVV